ncbi:glucose-6-phosphate isomerase [Luteimonas sp. M1R5S18]|jgi:glucose-6-phosphate isomerase|uniref:Glucose-6-phosphate isomerase n=1 Tax=Luteimonas rhizosphaericola TaxID=3042024 RepID=A0ABT6JFN7_9GAMM|nr:glucose-6-phosphate isomerase [Luteimonas rhizosphaericola]MDH5829487.1 glucose-6-phosphate isomerase [Luteimonas rhizosphaericola]
MPDFATLRSHAARLADTPVARLLQDEPERARALSLRVGPLYANFARQRYDGAALDALYALADDAGFARAMRRLLDGETVNATEGRAALHSALRGDASTAPFARECSAQAAQARVRMRTLVEAVVASGVTDVVSVGIGGSDLGPRLVADALAQPDARVRVHFLSNVDGNAARRTLAGLDPAKTAAILISKTFGTQETLLNGAIVRDWLGDDARVYAVSANVERAAAFGIAPERILPMWDWVGGRYSLWSAVGFPIALAIGMDRFEALLAGAAELDAHAANASPRENLAILHALTALWNRNALGLATQAVLPYDERLRLLPNYLQQLVMESLGKSARLDGVPLAEDTVPVWWGGPGTDTQHSFFQALHQGTQVVPADFIGVVRSEDGFEGNHRALLANLLAQTEALANGQSSDDPHRAYAGNRPSTLLLLDALTPQSLGMLIALYEHSVYLQSVAWGINAFDQFGVELGKQVANRLLPALEGKAEADDPVTRALLAEIASRG